MKFNDSTMKYVRKRSAGHQPNGQQYRAGIISNIEFPLRNSNKIEEWRNKKMLLSSQVDLRKKLYDTSNTSSM